MWAHLVVVGTPGIEHRAGLWQRHEQGLVQALVAQPADEALGEGVLLRLCPVQCSARLRRSPRSTSGSPCWSAPCRCRGRSSAAGLDVRSRHPARGPPAQGRASAELDGCDGDVSGSLCAAWRVVLGMPILPRVRLTGRCEISTVLRISSFSDAEYLMRYPPHPRSRFF
jgi:hypothetical protein